MGAMCGQSSQDQTCLIGVERSSKLAVFGPPGAGKTSLISYLFNRQLSKSQKSLITGEKKVEYLSKFYSPTAYNGTKFQGISQRSKMVLTSKKDNGLPFYLYHIYAQSNCKNSPIYHLNFAQIKDSEGDILSILEGLFISKAFLMVVDAQTVDQLYKYQRLTIHQTKYHRVILLNKVDQLSQQSAQKLHQSLEKTNKYCCTIPISCKDGDNIFHRSARTNWYTGPRLIDFLQEESTQFFSSISSINRSQQIVVLKVSHSNKKSTTIFGMYTGWKLAGGIHVSHVLQVLPLGIAAKVASIHFQEGIYVSLTLDQYLDIDQEKCLFLLNHKYTAPQNPTSLTHLSKLEGVITFFDDASIRQAGFNLQVHYHNKVVKGQLLSYTIPYKENERTRHGKIQLFQLLWHEQGYGKFYILDHKRNPIAILAEGPYKLPYSPPVQSVQPIRKEPLRIEQEMQYKVTFQVKSKKTLM